MGFVLVTLVLPAAVFWFLSRIEAMEFHWAVLLFGIAVVALASFLYGVSPAVWHFEGREGYVKDIIDKYSQGLGLVGVVFAIGLGVMAGELAADAWKKTHRPG
jgi:hypothetical protein